MVKDTELHLYLNKSPEKDELNKLLPLYGFKFVKEIQPNKVEPVSYQWIWKVPQLSLNGFNLLFFTDVCKDDLNFGSYGSFVILSGYQNSSFIDLAMVDIVSVLLLSRYGGKVHNPQRIDKISTDILLSGAQFNLFSSKKVEF